jgi:hypothetical protein
MDTPTPLFFGIAPVLVKSLALVSLVSARDQANPGGIGRNTRGIGTGVGLALLLRNPIARAPPRIRGAITHALQN